mmetsp:Transcript_8851/g.12546  ORF Transcript_8851/g.12546 Transcript_8851/m.12546 type:complete len:259 (+) Transcript_8851:315-1091(+)
MSFIHKKNSEFFSLVTAFVTSHDSSELCDATLVSNDGTSFPVHKLVLAMRSEYFSTLFYRKQWHKDTSIFQLDFDAKVVKAIKSYCYKDDCDDGFSKSVDELEHLCNYRNPGSLGRRQRLDEVMSKDKAVSNACYLVSLTAAADYLMLTGLTRMLWKVAYGIMCNHLPVLIPTIYDEATKHGSEELRQLARHCFHWLSPERVLQNMEDQEADSKLLEQFEPADPEIDYDRYGVILVMGCSDLSINGTYYGCEVWGGAY